MNKKKEESKKVGTQMSLQHEGIKSKRALKSDKAQLIFPVGRILRKMKRGRYADRISSESAVSVASVLEYMVAELIELAGDNCYGEDQKMISKNIKPRHICLGIKQDNELNEAIGKSVIIPMGGVIPFIHESLEQKKKRRNKMIEKFKDDMAEDSDHDESTDNDEDD
jgi:histone H2A